MKKKKGHFSSTAAWDRNSLGPLAAFMDNPTACGPFFHLAIVGVGRKKSHFMDNLAAFMDNLTALMDNQVYRPRDHLA